MKGQMVRAMFHSRLAAAPALNSPISSHPFIGHTRVDVLLLAHNGRVEVENPSATLILYSEWALSVITEAGGLEDALPQLKNGTRLNSALNLLLLTIPRDERMTPTIQCLNYFKTEQPGRANYSRMYSDNFPGERIVLFSTAKDPEIGHLMISQLRPLIRRFVLKVNRPSRITLTALRFGPPASPTSCSLRRH
jgi:hypothetical protein